MKGAYPTSDFVLVMVPRYGVPPSPKPSRSPFTYDFIVSTTGGSGSGSIDDPWSLAYATNQAQADGKLPMSGAHLGLRGGDYARLDAGTDFIAHGVPGSGTPALDGKLIYRNYNGERATIREINSGIPPTGIDNVQLIGSHVVLWGLELACTLNARVGTEPGGPTNISMFLQDVTGCKVIECFDHDGAGGLFVEDTTHDFECYGSIFLNTGWAGGDGGGHHTYIHHRGPVYANFQCNIYGPDEGVGVQVYANAGVHGHTEYVNLLDNIHVNSGTLNNVPNIGGVDGQSLEIGGQAAPPTTEYTNHINCLRNFFFWPDGYGDSHIRIGQGGIYRLGPAIVVDHNYGYGGGAGFGVLSINNIVDLASGGLITLTNNTFRVKQNYGNARLIYLSENGGAGYAINSNTFYRKAGAGEPPILGFRDNVGSFRTKAQFEADCGFGSIGTIADDPTTPTIAIVIGADKYSYGRANCCYYNFQGLSRIPFNLGLTLIPGDKFKVHDFRDPLGTPIDVFDSPAGGSVVTTYTGGLVYFPTTQVADPVMSGSNWGVGVETAPPATAPFFNAFIVEAI
jgi:hypothetical protein